MNTRFAIAMARREMRASARRLGLYGSCMALGIAALVGLGGLRASVAEAVAEQAQRLLGADLRLASRAPFPADVEARVARLTSSARAPAARVTQFASMVLATTSGRTRIADVRALAGGFPFYGEIRTEPPGAWQLLGSPERLALVDESLLVQLDAPVGSTLAVGEARFRVAGTLTRAPGSVGVRTQIAPRVFIAGRHLEATRLVRPGSLVDHLLYVAAPAELLEPWLDANRPALEAERVRIQTVESYQADLGRSFAIVTRYLGLVGLAALALGGIGVASGVRVFVREKLDAVALLRCLGAGAQDVLAAYGVLALGLGAASGVVGATLGVGFQWLLPALVRGLLPVPVEPRLVPAAIATGIGLGLWVTTLFAAAPLLELARVPPLRALRRGFEPARGSRRTRAALVIALAASVLGASLWQAPTARVGVGFAAGLGAALACLAAAAVGAAALLHRVRPRRAPYWLRQGIANLSRPRNHTVATSVAIGFGLFVISTLHAVQYNVRHQLALDARPDRPNLVLFDVQRDQVADLEAFLAERDVPVLEHAPVVSARIAGLGGRDTTAWLGQDELDRDRRWALRREYRLTYAAELRSTETLSDGRWWPSEPAAPGAPAPVSLEVEIAETLGIGVGDRVTWDVQGVFVETQVTSLREVDWGRLASNFFVVFPPGVLDDAPSTSFLLARVEDDAARAVLQRDLVGRFPNVSALDITLILAALDAMHREMATAVQVLALFTLATGLAILVAAAAAARSERTREMLLLRTLGASSKLVRRIAATEAIALAALAATVGGGLSLAAAWGLAHFVFELPFDPPAGDLALLSLATVCIGAALGATRGPSPERGPLTVLREAESTGVGAG